MPNIKGNTNYNNGEVKADVKKTSKKFSGQVSQDEATITSSLQKDDLFVNATLSSGNNFVGTTPKQKSNIIKTDVQSFGNATTEKKGIARFATMEEVLVGEDNSTIVTPYTLKKTVISDKYYVHEQGVASNKWIINHNLNKKPSVMVVDSADNVVEGAEKYIDGNTIEIRFNGAFKGKAYLN